MTAPAAGPCPICGADASSVSSASRIDVMGDHETLSMACPAGHSWSVTDESRTHATVRRALAHLRH